MASRSTGADLSGDSYKIVLIGDCGVGKTSILLRLVDGTFKDDEQLAKGIEYKDCILTVDNKMAKLSIWDTPQETKRFIDCDCNPPIYRGAAGIMIVYDSTDEALAAKHAALFKQTSALDGTNIQAAFEDLVRAIRLKRCPDTITITKKPTPTKHKSSCY